MKVAEFLKRSGLYPSASVTFTDLQVLLDDPSPPGENADTGAGAAGLKLVAAAAPAQDHQAGLVMAWLRAEYPEVAATLEKEATADKGEAPTV